MNTPGRRAPDSPDLDDRTPLPVQPSIPLTVMAEGSAGEIVLPAEVLARMKVKADDRLYLTEAADGGYRITPDTEEFARQMAHAEKIMRDDREVLRALAK